MSETLLSIWTVYDRPRDFPEVYVARRHEVSAGASTPTRDVICSADLEIIRDEMQRRGLVKLARDPDDEAMIVENWL